MVRALVARGLGYSLLTQETAITASYEGHAFVTVPLADQLPALQIVVAQIGSARPTRRAQAFLDQCLESFAPVTPG